METDVIDIRFAAGPFDAPSQDLVAQVRIDIGRAGRGVERLGELPAYDVSGRDRVIKAQLPGNTPALKDGFGAGRTGSPSAAMIQKVLDGDIGNASVPQNAMPGLNAEVSIDLGVGGDSSFPDELPDRGHRQGSVAY